MDDEHGDAEGAGGGDQQNWDERREDYWRSENTVQIWDENWPKWGNHAADSNEDSNGLNGENGFFMQQNSQEDFQGFQDHNLESNSKLVTERSGEEYNP